jgi:Tol biopolymer transport system component
MLTQSFRRGAGLGLAGLLAAGLVVSAAGPHAAPPRQPKGASPGLLEELKHYRHQIIFETNRDGNWEIYRMNADGSNPVNLTRTADVDELYPKASPDGTKICFCADESKGDAKQRNLYVMNSNGSDRVKIADNAREPCWKADGTEIAYMKGEFKRFTFTDFATRGLFIYNLKTGKTRPHPNKKLHHLYTLNWSPDGKWFVATVHGGMGFQHGIVAIEANGDKVFDLHLDGCRPDLSPDAKQIAWGHGDFCAGVADLDLTGAVPRAGNIRDVVQARDPIETYHVDWSPEGKYLAFTRGPKLAQANLKGLLPELPGVQAPGWNICVADAKKRNRWVALTLDGKSNKEPDWLVVPEGTGK